MLRGPESWHGGYAALAALALTGPSGHLSQGEREEGASQNHFRASDSPRGGAGSEAD